MRKTLRNFAIVTIVATLMMSTMVACGNNEVPTNAIVEPTPTIEASEPIEEKTPDVEPSVDGIVDEGTLDVDVEDVEGEGLGLFSKDGLRTNYTSQFPEGTTSEAWVEEHTFENPDWAYYIAYFKGSLGEMSFAWVGFSGMGDLWGLSDDEITFSVANDKARLDMWTYGVSSNENELMRNYDANTLMSASIGTPIVETFQVEDNEDFYRVIFQVNRTLNGESYIGYDCYIDYYDSMETYQFEYIVEESIFDEVEALAVVNSIERANIDDFGIVVE